MNALIVGACAVAGAVAAVPVSAIAFSASTDGPIRLPRRWWTGAPATRTSVLVVAALCASTAAVIGAAVPATALLAAFWLFAVVGVALAVIDLRYRRLPHSLTGVLLATSALGFAVTVMSGAPVGSLIRAALAGALTAAAMLTIALAVPGQLGLGDVTLTGVIAFNLGWFSWQAPFYGVTIGWLLQGVIVLVSKGTRLGATSSPMGPALICGWLLAVVLAA